MWGPMGQWVQEEHGCHRLHNRMVFISVRDEDNLFCRARQCYLPARLEEAVSRKGESLFTHRKLKFPSCCFPPVLAAVAMASCVGAAECVAGPSSHCDTGG